MASLKDQLVKLGFKSTVPASKRPRPETKTPTPPPKKVERRPAPPQDKASSPSGNYFQLPKHQVTFCDACQSTFPDVEFYDHRNRLLQARWVCVRCADTHKIHDDCRMTMQSDFAKKGHFRREYGPTHKRLKNPMR